MVTKTKRCCYRIFNVICEKKKERKEQAKVDKRKKQRNNR